MHVRIIQDAPGHRARRAGAPLTSPELFVVVDHPLKRAGTAANVPLRGVSPEAFKVHNRLKIVEGRNLEFGKNEIIAGRAAARQFVNLNVGTTLKWGENTWKLVGIFEEGGSGVGIRAVVRREGAPAGISARQQLPVGLCARWRRLTRSSSSRTR